MFLPGVASKSPARSVPVLAVPRKHPQRALHQEPVAPAAGRAQDDEHRHHMGHGLLRSCARACVRVCVLRVCACVCVAGVRYSSLTCSISTDAPAFSCCCQSFCTHAEPLGNHLLLRPSFGIAGAGRGSERSLKCRETVISTTARRRVLVSPNGWLDVQPGAGASPCAA